MKKHISGCRQGDTVPPAASKSRTAPSSSISTSPSCCRSLEKRSNPLSSKPSKKASPKSLFAAEERIGDQLRIHILSQLMQLSSGDPAHPAVFVIVYFSIRSGILSVGLHDYIVALRYETMGRCFIRWNQGFFYGAP